MSEVIAGLAKVYPQLYLNPDIDSQEDYRSIVLRGTSPADDKKRLDHYRGSEFDSDVTVDTPAGVVRVVTIGDRHDFELVLRGFLAAKNGPSDPVPSSQGAAMITVFNWPRIHAHLAKFLPFERAAELKRFTSVKENYLDMLIVLSRGPYSDIRPEGVAEADWISDSDTIRRYHELTHVICRRQWPDDIDEIRDELIADAVGLYAAYGRFDRELAMKFLGIKESQDEGGCSYTGGRLGNYTSDPGGIAGRICAALDRISEICDAFDGESVFELIKPLMEGGVY